jgi:hypothetical protein
MEFLTRVFHVRSCSPLRALSRANLACGRRARKSRSGQRVPRRLS